MGCGDDVEEDECEARAEVCSGILPEPNADPSNSSEPLTQEFQACLIANRPPHPPAQPILASMCKCTHPQVRELSIDNNIQSLLNKKGGKTKND